MEVTSMTNASEVSADTREEDRSILRPAAFDEYVLQHGNIQRRGVFGHLVHELGRKIVGGEYPVGSTLPNEPDLVARYGISRNAVREAMKCLAGKGLVEIKTRVGTRVRDRSSWHHLDTDIMVWHYESGPSVEIMRSIKDLRRVLEPQACARAALRGSEADLAKIAQAFHDMESSIGDINANADADLRFHSAIFAATGNVIYAQLIELISVAIYANRAISKPTDVARGQEVSLPFHRDVLDAILSRDPDMAIGASNRLLDSWQISRFDF
jgi:DNA-binding FadR family transcriptional regulator